MRTETTIKATIVATAAIVSTILIMDSRISDAEFKTYIETALQNGCPIVIDICTKDCGKDVVYTGHKDCLPAEIVQIDGRRAQDLYIELAEDYRIQEQSGLTGNAVQDKR